MCEPQGRVVQDPRSEREPHQGGRRRRGRGGTREGICRRWFDRRDGGECRRRRNVRFAAVDDRERFERDEYGAWNAERRGDDERQELSRENGLSVGRQRQRQGARGNHDDQAGALAVADRSARVPGEFFLSLSLSL